jgi:hypothetical protein
VTDINDLSRMLAIRIGGVLMEHDAAATVFYTQVFEPERHTDALATVSLKTDIPKPVEHLATFALTEIADIEEAAHEAVNGFLSAQKGAV